MYVCMYKYIYVQGLCQSRLSTADYDLLLIAPATTAVQSLERSMLDPRKVKASYISCFEFRLVQYCENLHFHDLV
jgi:hypothetical protein